MGNRYVRIMLACALAVLTAISAQIKFNLGPIPYTMQNFAIILSGLLLGRYGATAQLIYLTMILVGIPAGAGFEGGAGVLLGFTAGYLWMFPVSAYIMGIIRERVYKRGDKRELFLLWLGSIVAVIPMYVVGFLVFYRFAGSNGPLMEWCERVASYFGLHLSPFLAVFFASVLVFVPQDIFMDHVMAIAVFRYIYDFLKAYDIA